MAAQTSMAAHAAQLLSRSDRWAKGYRQADGLQFFLFRGSKGEIYLSAERGCTCPSARYRGQCAHVEAIKADIEQAREKAARRPSTYDRLFPDLEDAF